MSDSEPLSVGLDKSPEDFDKSLTQILTSLSNRANEGRRGTDSWKFMFEKSEQGLRGLLSEAQRQSMTIILNLTKVIEERYQIVCSAKLYDLCKALPFAMNKLRNEIDETQGMMCCADKARQVYYEEVLSEINRIKEEDDKVKGRANHE